MALPPLQFFRLQLLQLLQLLVKRFPEASSSSSSAAADPPAPAHRAVQLLMKQMALPPLQLHQLLMKQMALPLLQLLLEVGMKKRPRET